MRKEDTTQPAKEEKTALHLSAPSLSRLSPQPRDSGRRTKLPTTYSCLSALTPVCVDDGRSQSRGPRATQDSWRTAKKSSVFHRRLSCKSRGGRLRVKTKLSLQLRVWNEMEFFFLSSRASPRLKIRSKPFNTPSVLACRSIRSILQTLRRFDDMKSG